MEIVTGSTGEAHVTPIDDAVRNTNTGFYNDRVVFNTFQALEATAITANEVRVYGGYGMNQGRIFKIDEADYDSVTIENGAQGVKRADLIVARYTMNAQTGVEDISLAVIKGQSGSEYIDPEYTTGNMNEGDDLDEFPLYRVKINGIVIEAVERLFTPMPDGGRLGQLESQFNAHLANNTNPHTISWTASSVLAALNPSDTLAVLFGKIAKAVTDLIAHIARIDNPHNVGGSQLADVVPISKGGTGATTAQGALTALGVPTNIADAMSKEVYTDTSSDAIKPAKGGTGRTSWTVGKVLVGNGTAAATERSIDSTSGGVANSDALTTSGALNATNANIQNQLTAMRASFQDGVDTIYNACRDNFPSAEVPQQSTPTAIAASITSVMSTIYLENSRIFTDSPVSMTFYLPVLRLKAIVFDIDSNDIVYLNDQRVQGGVMYENFAIRNTHMCKIEIHPNSDVAYTGGLDIKYATYYEMNATNYPYTDPWTMYNPY